MHLQKRKEQIKDYEKQEKRLKELKASGQSKKAAEKKQKEALTKKQEKNRAKLQKNETEENGPTELMMRPKEYIVKFRFQNLLHSNHLCWAFIMSISVTILVDRYSRVQTLVSIWSRALLSSGQMEWVNPLSSNF